LFGDGCHGNDKKPAGWRGAAAAQRRGALLAWPANARCNASHKHVANAIFDHRLARLQML